MKDIEFENISTSGGAVVGHDLIDNSQGKIEINAPVIISSNSITEDRARLICKEEFQIALQNWSYEAGALAERRIRDLEDKIIPKMLEHDETLKIFGNPSFQMVIRKAQITAGCSDRAQDLDLLADLVLHRAKENGNKEHSVGITKAIEIVDQIASKALIAISLVYAYQKLLPVSNDMGQGLGILDELYDKIKQNIDLPTDQEWLEHLDVLSVVRLSNFGGFRKAKDFQCKTLSNYLTLGIDKKSEEYCNLVSEFRDHELPLDMFVQDHPLRPGFARWWAPYDIDSISLIEYSMKDKRTVIFSDKQREVLKRQQNILIKDGSEDSVMRDSFWDLYSSYPNLKLVSDWWDSFKIHFQITPIGVALANAYIHGIDPSVPLLY